MTILSIISYASLVYIVKRYPFCFNFTATTVINYIFYHCRPHKTETNTIFCTANTNMTAKAYYEQVLTMLVAVI